MNYLCGYNCDELGALYDGLNISRYGHDRYFNAFPLYFNNFGGGQSALLVYLTAIFGKIIGFTNILAVRLPNALLNIGSIVCGFFLIKKTRGNKSALTFMMIMVTMPWYIMQSRIGLDCNLQASMCIIAITMLVCSKKGWQYFISGILLGLVLYTYIISIVVIPIFLILTLIYLVIIKKISLKNIIMLIIPFVIVIIPIVLTVLINKGILPQINGLFTIPKLIYERNEVIGFRNFDGIILNLQKVFTSDEHIYNSIPLFGNIFYFAIPLSIFGIFIAIKETILSIKKKEFNISSIFILLFIANIPLILFFGVHSGRIQTIFIPIMYFIYLSIRFVYKNTKIGFTAILMIYIIMTILSTGYYFTTYENDCSSSSYVDKDYTNVIKRIDEIDQNKTVYVRYATMQPWIYEAVVHQTSLDEIYENMHDDSPLNKRVNYFEYGRYYYFYETLQEIDEEAIYVLGYMTDIETNKSDEDRINLNNLRDKNFTEEKIGEYIIFYK